MDSLNEVVRVEESNPGWVAAYSREKFRILGLVQAGVEHLEHIGSTAVPGLAAKPIIDMMVGVRSYPPPQTVLLQLASLGYDMLGEAGVPGRLYFRLRGAQDYNLHVVKHRGKLWQANLLLRDFLVDNAQARTRYAAAKYAALVGGAHDLLSYSEHKAGTIEGLLAEARLRADKLFAAPQDP